MKNFLLAAAVAGLGLTSCSTIQNGQVAQNQRAEFLKMKGSWTLTNVNYDSSRFRIQPFDENADAQCWVGSTWNLIPNNWTGSYTLNGGGNCPSVTQPIKFEIQNGDTFSFKKISDGTKPKNNTAGYTLQVSSMTPTSLVLTQQVAFEGQTIPVTYTFQKN